MPHCQQLTVHHNAGRVKKPPSRDVQSKWERDPKNSGWLHPMGHDAENFPLYTCVICSRDPPQQRMPWGKLDQGVGLKVRDVHQINEHRESQGHKDARSRLAGAAALEAGLGHMEAAQQARVETTRHVIVAAAYWLALQKLPGSHLPQLLTLLRLFNAEGFNPGDTFQYNNHRYFIASMYAVSDMLLAQQLERIRKSPFYTVMLDESTDLASMTQVSCCNDHCQQRCSGLDSENSD
jgi:hypothetical protein